MRKTIIFLLIIFPFNIILPQALSFENIKGTSWVYEFEKNANDSLIFKMDSTYIEYSAELDEHFLGKYKIERDTLILFQDKEDYDNHFLNCSEYSDYDSIQKYILTELSLLKIIFAKYNSTIIRDFDEIYLFKKI